MFVRVCDLCHSLNVMNADGHLMLLFMLLDPRTVLPTTAYSISNLYALLNDFIVTRKCPAASAVSNVRDLPSYLCTFYYVRFLDVQCSVEQQVLLWLLSLLDTLEVAVEMMSQHLFREPGKWGMVILLQIIR